MSRERLKAALRLGNSPLRRRVVAALILIGAAMFFAFARGQGVQFWIELVINVIAAVAALVFLHLRWRRQERKAMTRGQMKDIFE
jgi:hypothetical protein